MALYLDGDDAGFFSRVVDDHNHTLDVFFCIPGHSFTHAQADVVPNHRRTAVDGRQASLKRLCRGRVGSLFLSCSLGLAHDAHPVALFYQFSDVIPCQ